ncbi:MAG: hypothetical protein KAU95_02225, partial [Candidatus Aenigmarchaeota archaeon]|nr:hypothetical protein [Candidatus Aenigmarchaeota archaeon]
DKWKKVGALVGVGLIAATSMGCISDPIGNTNNAVDKVMDDARDMSMGKNSITGNFVGSDDGANYYQYDKNYRLVLLKNGFSKKTSEYYCEHNTWTENETHIITSDLDDWVFVYRKDDNGNLLWINPEGKTKYNKLYKHLDDNTNAAKIKRIQSHIEKLSPEGVYQDEWTNEEGENTWRTQIKLNEDGTAKYTEIDWGEEIVKTGLWKSKAPNPNKKSWTDGKVIIIFDDGDSKPFEWNSAKDLRGYYGHTYWKV